jgi:hypothetical protein
MSNQLDSLVVDSLTVRNTAELPSNCIANAQLKSDANISRSKLAQSTLKPYTIPLTEGRIHDAIQTPLTGTANTDDLGITGGTFGTDAPTITAGDLKAAGATTRYVRFPNVPIPAEYDDGQTLTLRVRGGMGTTVADVSATVDAQAYKPDGEGAVGGDLVATDAQSINDTNAADCDFTITPTGLVAGDTLDVRIAVAVNDAATATAVDAEIYEVQLLADVRG